MKLTSCHRDILPRRVLNGTIFGAAHCDGHHYVAVQHAIEAVEIGEKTKNVLGKSFKSVGNSGVARGDSAVHVFVKDLIDASQAGP